MDEQQYCLADVYDNNGFLLAEKGVVLIKV